MLPARSVAVPVTFWLAPSTGRVTGSEQVATPELSSAHTKLTVTVLLFQPAAVGAGVMLPVIVGGVRSMFTVTVAVELFPAYRDWPQAGADWEPRRTSRATLLTEQRRSGRSPKR